MEFVGSALSDQGLRRSLNEDAFVYVPDLALFLVADGVGGHAAGEVASRMAATAIVSKLRELMTDDDLTPVQDSHGYPGTAARRLLIAVEHANEEVFGAGNDDAKRQGMGTTVAAVHMSEGFVNICHVGDSRVYRIRDGAIERLTEDHVIVANVLSRAVGTGPTVDASWRIEPLDEGDSFVLCTDGIHGTISDEEILATVERHGDDYVSACAALVALANGRGGPDNSTVILVRGR